MPINPTNKILVNQLTKQTAINLKIYSIIFNLQAAAEYGSYVWPLKESRPDHKGTLFDHKL